MTGIALDIATGDLLRGGDGGVLTDDGFWGPVLVSLFTDARAPDGMPLPDPAGPRRGWWGSSLVDDGEVGSLLWTLRREKTTPETVQKARSYAAAALAWIPPSTIQPFKPVTGVETYADWRPGARGILELDCRFLIPGRRARQLQATYQPEAGKFEVTGSL